MRGIPAYAGAVLLAAALSGCQIMGFPTGYEILDWGAAGVPRPSVHVLRDEKALEELFQRTLAKDWMRGQDQAAPALPRVDFSKRLVVAIFWGAKPSTAYGLSVESVRRGPSGVHVAVRTHVGQQGFSAISHPAAAVAVPRVPHVWVTVTGDRLGQSWAQDFKEAEGPGWTLQVR